MKSSSVKEEMAFTTGKFRFVMSETIECPDGSAFVRVHVLAEVDSGEMVPTHIEVGHGSTTSQALALAQRVRTSREPITYANACCS